MTTLLLKTVKLAS